MEQVIVLDITLSQISAETEQIVIPITVIQVQQLSYILVQSVMKGEEELRTGFVR